MVIHSQKLERWLGTDQIDKLQMSMQHWYADPIGVANVPGKIYIRPDGDFEGKLKTGRYSTLFDLAFEKTSMAIQRAARRSMGKMNAGFTSLSDLISEASAGKAQDFHFNKAGSAGQAAGNWMSLWGLGNYPPAGANAAAAPGGEAPTSATSGAFPFNNPTGGDTTHFITGEPTCTLGGHTLMLYDRIFQVDKTMNSSATEAVTGVPTRYQSTTLTDPDSAKGNFLMVEVGGTVLAATGHNWDTITYTDQSNNASTAPAMAGVSAAVVRRLDHPATAQWFMPLASGDSGIKALTQMQCSAAVATGVVNFVIGHPIAFLPCPFANMVMIRDGLNSAFNLTRIFDNAALAFLELKSITTAATYGGTFRVVSG